MCTTRYGRTGAWTESLGIIGPLQEMLISSWNNTIELFPHWPGHKAARFDKLRAKGAFLVSAELTPDGLSYVKIHSESGGICRLKFRNTSIEISTEAGKDYNVVELLNNQ
jgi:hypothetical protein